MSKVAEKKYPGVPVEIINFGYKIGGSKLQFDKKAFEKILSHESVIDRKISIISIVGAFRKGKSFFLGYCLRFLYTIYKSVGSPNAPFRKVAKYDWRGDKDEPLHGFSWKSGADRHTTGIIVWSDVFLYDSPNGDKIAILLMDTQGLFDNKSSPTENSRIFSLSTLISSMQIYNLHGQIQEDQLQYLQFATNFAKYITDGDSSNEELFKPFQNLMFLIRDWQHTDDYGFDGGEIFLNNFTKIEEDQVQEIKSLRQWIKESFEDISCFLLPHPGKDATKKCFDGRWSEIDKDFLDHLDKLIPNLLAPDNLKLKKICGETITAGFFYNCVVLYSELFKSEKLPEVQSIYEATVSNQMNKLVKESREVYNTVYTSENSELNDESEILPLHKKAFTAALENYYVGKKMGTKEHNLLFKNDLIKQLMAVFKKWEAEAIKNIGKIKEEQRKIAEDTKNIQNIIEEARKKIELAKKKLKEAEEAEKKRKIAELNEKHRARKNTSKWIWIPGTILAFAAAPLIVLAAPVLAMGTATAAVVGGGVAAYSGIVAATAGYIDATTPDQINETNKL